jgi:glycerol-3-phosphate cytidylyltransferase-like family protein
MKRIVLFLAILNFNLKAECYKEVNVRVYENRFSLNLFSPNISNKEYDKKILISCEFYKKIKKGDEFRDYEVYKEIKGDIIPHGEMIKYKIKIL